MAKLSKEQRIQIVAERINGATYREMREKYGVSYEALRKVVEASPEELKRKLEEKEELIIKDVFDYMKSRTAHILKILDNMLNGMEEKSLKTDDMFTNLKDYATAFGIMSDKLMKYEELKAAKESRTEPIEIILTRRDEGEVKDGNEKLHDQGIGQDGQD